MRKVLPSLQQTVDRCKPLVVRVDAEKDSLLFYYEMRDIMPKRAQETVNRVITEEKSHLRQLSILRRRLAGAENGQ